MFFGASKGAESARVQVSLCKDQSCNDDKRENKDRETTSE